MAEKHRALYGSIPYFGGEYTVYWTRDGNRTRVSRGYGDFPFDRFDIPVIDYRGNDAVMDVLALSTYCREVEREHTTNKVVSLAEYMDIHRRLGIPILDRR